MSTPAVRTRARALGALLVVAVTVALGGTACNPGRPPAAVVRGAAIAPQRVDDLVAAFAAADDTLRGEIEREGEGTYSSDWAADALRILITRVAAAELAAERRVIVDATHRADAESELARSLLPTDPEGGTAVVDAIAPDTRAWLLELVAAELALRARLATEAAADPEAVRDYYDQNVERFAQVCLGLLVVAPDDIESVRARVDGGEDFVAVAAEASLEPDALGPTCSPLLPLQQQLQPEAFASIAAAGEGDVVGPFQYDAVGNVVLVQVTGQGPVPFEDIAEQLAAELPGDLQVQALLARELAGDHVRVDPRFGRWDPEALAVVPPAGPRS